MVGGALNLFDGQTVLRREGKHQLRQMLPCRLTQRRKLGHAGVTQGDEPGHLDLNAAVHKAVLAHEQLQRLEFVGVSAIQGR